MIDLEELITEKVLELTKTRDDYFTLMIFITLILFIGVLNYIWEIDTSFCLKWISTGMLIILGIYLTIYLLRKK